jgi:hypothetical protein
MGIGFALLVFFLPVQGTTLDDSLSNPENTLAMYLKGLREGSIETVLKCYYSERKDFKLHLPHPIKIDKYIVTKRTVYTDKMAEKYEAVPKAEAGDVELEVRECIEGKDQMFTYLFRKVDGGWRIISHGAWDQP